MKLLIIVALIDASLAARLDHLEPGYLPPGQANSNRSPGSSFSSAQGSGTAAFDGSNNALSQGSTGFGGSFQSRSGAPAADTFGASSSTSQQLASPSKTSFQNIPQQAFDEETGYDYSPGVNNFRATSSSAPSGSSPRFGDAMNLASNQRQSITSRFNAPTEQFGAPESNIQFGQSSAGQQKQFGVLPSAQPKGQTSGQLRATLGQQQSPQVSNSQQQFGQSSLGEFEASPGQQAPSHQQFEGQSSQGHQQQQGQQFGGQTPSNQFEASSGQQAPSHQQFGGQSSQGKQQFGVQSPSTQFGASSAQQASAHRQLGGQTHQGQQQFGGQSASTQFGINSEHQAPSNQQFGGQPSQGQQQYDANLEQQAPSQQQFGHQHSQPLLGQFGVGQQKTPLSLQVQGQQQFGSHASSGASLGQNAPLHQQFNAQPSQGASIDDQFGQAGFGQTKTTSPQFKPRFGALQEQESQSSVQSSNFQNIPMQAFDETGYHY